MNYFLLNNGNVVQVASSINMDDPAFPGFARSVDGRKPMLNGWANRNDFFSLEEAAAVAVSASELGQGAYLAVDRGDSWSPRFDVIRAPAVGDEVSMAFNGDSYPIGKIVSISAGYKRVEVDGPRGRMRFNRKGAGWVEKGGFSLVRGSVFKLNPEF